MTRFKITQEILDYISEHSANFSRITPSPTLGEEWIVKDIKTYPNVNNGNSVVEAEREDGCYIRIPENIVKIYTIDKEQTGKFCLQEEPVSNPIDFEKELYKAFGQVKDFTLGMRIAKWFYDMGKKSEPVSEDLEAAIECCGGNKGSGARVRTGFIMGAKWQKEHLWKPSDGDDLPEIDREVIVFTQPYPLEGNEYVVSFAHRPNPDGWDGKSLTSGKVVHYTPKTYDKGGWNIPDVKYWLDIIFPNK